MDQKNVTPSITATGPAGGKVVNSSEKSFFRLTVNTWLKKPDVCVEEFVLHLAEFT